MIGRREGEDMYVVIVYIVNERNVHEVTERSLCSRECRSVGGLEFCCCILHAMVGASYKPNLFL